MGIAISFTVVALFAMGAFGITMYHLFTDRMEAMMSENAVQLLDQTATNLESYLKNMRRISDTMYYSVIKDKDLASEDMVQEMNLLYDANKENLVSIACYTSNGNLVEAVPVAGEKEDVYKRQIENYSRHLAGLKPGQPPHTLMDYFPDDSLIIIDESHKTIPQIRGMYFGDQSRKNTLVDYGFRLPSAKDNRPLNFEEFESKINQMLFVSATPGDYEAEHELLRAEQIIRPTGLLDPEVSVRPVEGQIDDPVSYTHLDVYKRQGKG